MPSLVGECLAIMSRRSLALQQHTVECACARLRVAAGRRTDEDDEDDENKEAEEDEEDEEDEDEDDEDDEDEVS